jgi:hypothetical protein
VVASPQVRRRSRGYDRGYYIAQQGPLRRRQRPAARSARREKEERKRRDKQHTLEAVFKQGTDSISRGIEAIVNNGQAIQSFIDSWDKNRKHAGFQYARLRAIVDVELHRSIVSGRMAEIESMTKYRLISLNVIATSWSHEFEMEDIGEAKALPWTDKERVDLIKQGTPYVEMIQRTVQRRAIRYTIVPPLHTPFDIVVTKLNNLYLDIAVLASYVGRGGDPGFKDFSTFNYLFDWNEQFGVLLEFDPPLNRSACEFCLSYLYDAAKALSKHPLEQQDLAGNFEDPRKGWKRRFWLLAPLLDPRYAPNGRNFSFVGVGVKQLVTPGHTDPEVDTAMDELFAGARTIWRDLERIERNIRYPEYFYLGPTYTGQD